MTKRAVAELTGRATLSELAATVEIEADYVGKGVNPFDGCSLCLDVPGKDGLGRPCKGCYQMFEWRVTLAYQGHEWAGLPYYMGLVHVEPTVDKAPKAPTAGDVISSLVLDSSALDNTFEEWAGDFGYDTDSRRAEAAYRACMDNAIKLRRLLGKDWDTFMNAENDI